MTCEKERKKVLVIMDGLPSKENPHFWKHAFDQAVNMSEKLDFTIISPVHWTLSLRDLQENGRRLRKLPHYNYMIGTIRIWRPRYVDFSFINWNYRKHYIQIVTIIASLLCLIIKKRIKFDIIHAHFVYRPGYIAAVLGKIFGKPVIITAHGTDIHQNLYNESTLYRKRTLAAMRLCKKIITNSEYIKKMIDDEGFGNKTSLIPCGFSEREFYPMDKNECRTKLSFGTNKKILLFIGNLVRVKGVDILIEAFKIIRDKYENVELIIIGDGPERHALEHQANNYDVDRMIHFLGRKDHNEIPLYINSADIIVLPSRDEGRALVVFEALACGRPVVASRVGGIPETIVNDELGILVEKENPVALADGIIRALSCKWDSSYQSNYVKQYSNTRLVENIIEVYYEVLNRK